MSASKKPRSDSKLKTLPEERQAEIFDYAAENSLVETVKWLRDDGLVTSKSALSEFLSWRQLRVELQQDEGTVDTILEDLKKDVAAISEEQLDVFGQKAFSLLSIRRQDANTFLKVRSARARAVIEKEKLKLREKAEARLQEGQNLQREKFERESVEYFLKWRQDKESERIAELSVPNEEKIKLMRRHWFADVDALEQTGSVKIPD